MLDALTLIKNRIETIKTNTREYKKENLDLLLIELNEILNIKNDLFHFEIDNLILFCKALLLDSQFTYKQVSLFGALESRSKVVVSDLLKILQEQRLQIALEKIRYGYESQHDQEALNRLKNIDMAVSERNFVLAAKQFEDLVESRHTSSYLIKAYDFVSKTFAQRLKSRVELPLNAHQFERIRSASFEINKNQHVFYVEDVMAKILEQPQDQLLSFSFTIDQFKNVLFSEDAKNSHHINHCEGKRSFGAGEIYFKRHDQTIEVVEINNESGLYEPSAEFLIPLTQWLRQQNFVVTNIQRKDSHEKFANYNAEIRMLIK